MHLIAAKKYRKVTNLQEYEAEKLAAPKGPYDEIFADSKNAARLPYKRDLKFHEAPVSITFENVLSHYRVGGSYFRNILSLFELHTETMNAWTMIFCSAMSIWLLLSSFQAESSPPISAKIVTFSALIHMPFSVGFHLFRGMNPVVGNMWRKLDQFFIFIASVILTAGLGWDVFPKFLFRLVVCIATIIACWGCTLIYKLQPGQKRNRWHVVFSVAAIVLVYLFPIMYQVVSDIVRRPPGTSILALDSLHYLVMIFLSLISAGVIYACGYPEKIFPGKFDVFGGSHQLMHFGAIGAHYFEFMFVIHMHQRKQNAFWML